MGIDRSVLGYEIYKIVASKDYHFTVAMFNKNGESTVTPLSATWMYLKPENIMIRIPRDDEPVRDEVTFWKSESHTDPKIKDIVIRLKDACQLFGTGFTVKDFAKDNDPKEFNKLVKRDQEEQELHQVKESIMLEGLTGSRQRSVFALENAKMIIHHSKFVQEDVHGARSRNIKSIQLESNGERFNYPIKHLPSARAMTRHLSNGGTMNDKMGVFIIEQAKDLISLRSFVKENKSTKITNKAKSYIKDIMENMKRMQYNSGYSRLKESAERRPVIGKKITEARANRYLSITGLNESKETSSLLEVFARHDIREDYSLMGVYRKVIQECNLGLDAPVIRNSARRISRGEITASSPILLMKTGSVSDKIKNYADQLSTSVNDSDLSKILVHISNNEPTNDMASLVQGILKSINLNDFSKEKYIPSEEEHMFESWTKNLGK